MLQFCEGSIGVTKVAGELICDYYAKRCGLDARGLGLPGLISHVAPPGGGTTDHAVDIFHQAVRYAHYTCFLAADTRLDMMYMPDAIAAMIAVMEVEPSRLKHRNAYNVTAMSITPDEVAAEIRRHIPAFAIDYNVDPVREAIADSWPHSLDDDEPRADWGWAPRRAAIKSRSVASGWIGVAREGLLYCCSSTRMAIRRLDARRWPRSGSSCCGRQCRGCSALRLPGSHQPAGSSWRSR